MNYDEMNEYEAPSPQQADLDDRTARGQYDRNDECRECGVPVGEDHRIFCREVSPK